MDYKLCKRLRDAGFPIKKMGDLELDLQEESLPVIVYQRKFVNEPLEDKVINFPESLLVPTFSELIEACGNYLALWKSSYDGQWHCSLSESGTGYENTYIDNDYSCPKTSGATPEEAVARLWLALHANSKNL